MSSLEEKNIDYEKNQEISSRESSDGQPETAHHFIDKIGLRFNAEIRGIERVPENQRTDKSFFSPLTMFLSPNLAISALSTGALGPILFHLDFRTCVLCIVFFVIIGALPVGFYSAFGMKFGLRQQILSRYFTGNIMGRVFALFNVISCIGWNAINILPCVQIFSALGPLPPWAGCLILVIITCFVALFGYKVIHTYEKYSWIPNFIIYLIMIARLTKSGNFTWGHMDQGTAEAGHVLSFIATIFGFVAGWSPSAADYSVYMPSDTSPVMVFMCMVVGLSVPAIFACILGAACAMGTFTSVAWSQAWEDNSVGGLVYAILVVDNLHGFGKFCVVILALSSIANNLPGSYSLALATQAIWSPLAKFPRLGWCLIGNFLSLALSIPAYYVFADTMANFLSIIGYNVSIYLGISLTEHFIYRKGFGGYNVTNFNDRSTTPVGFAGLVGFLFGVASTILSMNQSWYQGVISKKFGADGGDISFELNIIFAFVGYNIIRPFELKYYKR